MYKISWGQKSDRFLRVFCIVPNVDVLFDLYHILTGYGRNDGPTPVDIEVTNLDGHVIDMSKGLADAAIYGSRC